MSVLYHEPRKPDQVRKERLLVLVLACLSVLALMVLVLTDTDPIQRTCAAEDEVMVKVKDDAFDYQAGDEACVHIDYLEEPTP
jgi:hypothetical protein